METKENSFRRVLAAYLFSAGIVATAVICRIALDWK